MFPQDLRPDRLPLALRVAAYGFAVAVLLYLCLAPSNALPQEHLWDKAEHGVAWFVLAAIGLILWPTRPGRIAAFSLALGVLVEILQTAMPFGRDGDWHDWVADSIGVATALALWAAVRGLARMVPSRA